jgi:hypothetical protein
MPGKVVDIGSPKTVGPSGSLAIAVSRDGSRYLALSTGPNRDNKLIVKMMSYPDGKELCSFSADQNDPNAMLPFLFADNDKGVIACSEKGLAYIDLSSGRQTAIYMSKKLNFDDFAARRNYDQTILAGKDGVLTASGHFFPTGSQAKFDSLGNAWFRAGDGWTKIDRRGRQEVGSKPATLADDQSGVRGSIKLETRKDDLTYKGAHAFATSIWLVPNSDGAKSPAAFVAISPDYLSCGFVPGKNEIYIVSEQGTQVVPYKLTPKTK